MANPPPGYLSLMYPNGMVMSVQMYRWDIGSLSPVLWDGSLSTGGVTVGTVNQGSPGSSAWPVINGFSIPAFDKVILTYTDSTKATLSTAVFSSSGTTVATITLTQDSTHDTYTKS